EQADGGVKSTYQLAPGADPTQIRLTWRRAAVSLAQDGSLSLGLPVGRMHETAPIAWQARDGQRVPVPVRWAAIDVGLEDPAWGFSMGLYDPSLALTIDPTVLSDVTFLGGSGEDGAFAIAVDNTGAAYVTGETASTETTFPNGAGFGAQGAPGFDQSYN